MYWYGFLYSYYSEVSNISKLEKLLREGHLPITSGVSLYILKQLKASDFKLTHCSVVCLCTNNFKALYPGIVHGN